MTSAFFLDVNGAGVGADVFVVGGVGRSDCALFVAEQPRMRAPHRAAIDAAPAQREGSRSPLQDNRQANGHRPGRALQGMPLEPSRSIAQ